MPDRTRLRIGDRIRVLRVAASDLEQRDRELAEELPNAGWTADTVERLIRSNPVVMIDRIDEYGHPWFNCDVPAPDGSLELHTLAIVEDDSWELA